MYSSIPQGWRRLLWIWPRSAPIYLVASLVPLLWLPRSRCALSSHSLKTCCISGVCCKSCSLCAGPYCFPSRILRSLVSREKVRFQSDGFDLDLVYLTPQILVHGFPAVGPGA